MYFDCSHESIRYTGRYAPYGDAMTATATGSTFEIAFKGDYILLYFDTSNNEEPMPHLWLQIDDESKYEVPLYKYLRVDTKEGDHILKVIYKGGKEIQPRFFHPLVGKISFKGYEAEQSGILPPDNRKTIEFVGDSITEGVLIDVQIDPSNTGQDSRPFQDDVTATYAYITAQNLGLRDLHMGYGAVGVTKSGCGEVPKAAESYPYCFEGAPVQYDHPDYILINHGANDRGAAMECYIEEYRGLLDVIRKAHPDSVIICLSAFSNCHPKELCEMIEQYNKEKGDNIHFIDGTLWVPLEPLHPLRDGHKIIAQKLTEELKKII